MNVCRALQDPCEPMHCQAPAVMSPYIDSPASIGSWKPAVFAQRPTSLPFAITTIGESAWVVKTRGLSH